MVDLNELRNLAARVAASADLVDVRLFHLDSTLERVPVKGHALSYSFDSVVEVQESNDQSTALLVDGSYDVTLRQGDTDAHAEEGSDADEVIAYLKIQLAALYEIHEDAPEEFADEELDAFAQTTGLLTLHPYVRELVASMTSRMGLPALHLGTVRINLDKRNDDD